MTVVSPEAEACGQIVTGRLVGRSPGWVEDGKAHPGTGVVPRRAGDGMISPPGTPSNQLPGRRVSLSENIWPAGDRGGLSVCRNAANLILSAFVCRSPGPAFG
jgi:hypothetical protein